MKFLNELIFLLVCIQNDAVIITTIFLTFVHVTIHISKSSLITISTVET